MDIDWKKIKSEYITTEKSSYRKLSEKYGVSMATLHKRAQREKWPELKKRHYDKVVTKTVENIESNQVKKIERILTIADKLLDKIEKAVDELDIQLCKSVVKVKDIEYDNDMMSDKPTKESIIEKESIVECKTIIDRKGVQELASAIKSLKEVKMIRTVLDEEEQKARIEKLRRDAELDNQDDEKQCGVVLMPPIMDKLTPPDEDEDDG